jgi:hypothetical protein
MSTFMENLIEREKHLTNEELLIEVLDLAGGDDWDGCFTENGKKEYEYLKSKLRERLSEWLKQ